MGSKFNVRDYIDTKNMTEEQINKCEFWVTANARVRTSGKANYEQEKIQVNDKWNFQYLERKLDTYEDKEVIKFFRYGWPLNARETKEQEGLPDNQKGAKNNKEQVRRYLDKELKRGSIIGPFFKNPFGRKVRISPLDTRDKKDSTDQRIILNLSHPFKEGSVNHSIDKERYEGRSMELSYPTIDNLAEIVYRKGRGCKIFKRDLKLCYKQFFMDPKDIMLLGFHFEDRLYFDVSLSMGSKSSAFCCQSSTNTITHIFKEEGFQNVNYLDDLGGAEKDKVAEVAFDTLGNILKEIGIEEAKEKAQPPAHVVIFLGILFNTLNMTMTITEGRLGEIKEIIQQWLNKNSATLKEMQQLLGKLNFACSTIRAGRIFVSRIINTIKDMPSKGRRRLNREFKKDLKWWYLFMEDFDGISMIPDLSWTSPLRIMSTDSCLTGCGGWMEEGEYFHSEFPTWIRNRGGISINELETIALIIGIKLWGEYIYAIETS